MAVVVAFYCDVISGELARRNVLRGAADASGGLTSILDPGQLLSRRLFPALLSSALMKIQCRRRGSMPLSSRVTKNYVCSQHGLYPVSAMPIISVIS